MRVAPIRQPRFRTLLLVALLMPAIPQTLWAQACVTGTWVVNGVQGLIAGANGSGSFNLGGATYVYQDYGDSASVLLTHETSANLTVGGTYRFLGLASGTPVTQNMTAFINGAAHTLLGDGQCQANMGGAGLQLDGIYVARASWAGSFNQGECSGDAGADVQAVSFTRAAGTSFTLNSKVFCTASFGSSLAGVKLRFDSITPGAFLVRCDGSNVNQLVGVSDNTPTGLRMGAVWPNPSRGVFQANAFVPEGGTAILRLFDVGGRVVYARPVAPSASQRMLSMDARVAPGTYFLQLSQGARMAVQQVVIEN